MQYLSKDYSIRDLAKECGVSIATASKASYIPVEDIYRESGQHLMDRICRNAERAVKEYPGEILEKESTLRETQGWLAEPASVV